MTLEATVGHLDRASASAWVIERSEVLSGELAEVVTIEETHNAIAFASTLEHVVRVRDLSTESGIAVSKLRLRAERRMGELIREGQQRGEIATRGGDRRSADRSNSSPPSLVDLGLSWDESAQAQKLASVDESTFEAALDQEAKRAHDSRGVIPRAGVLRVIDPEGEKSTDTRWRDADSFISACKRVADLGTENVIASIRFGTYPTAEDTKLVASAVDRELERARAVIMQAINARKARN